MCGCVMVVRDVVVVDMLLLVFEDEICFRKICLMRN